MPNYPAEEYGGSFNRAAGDRNAKAVRSPITSATEAMSQAEDLIARVKMLADRLTGSAPEAVGEAYPPQSPALFDQMDQSAARLRGMLEDGNRALSRIEAMLP